jgi:DNA invertase Pin-like site-specific DNA recombinase
MNKTFVPAVAYLRRSTDKQEQSLGDQRLEVGRYAEEHGYQVIREYVDDAISGTSANERPGFQRMIAEAAKGDFAAVIVWNSDRFSRGDVTETEHYRYLLRQANVRVLSVTEDYLARDGIDGDVLRTVKQFQNRQYSISLSQNTLRGQISAVMAESDPGRAAPYGYDREIVAPDGAVLFRIRFCPGRVREVYDRDGKLQARYAKGQSLHKPGKECKARLVLSDRQRVQTVKKIFRMCLDGVGFASIAAELNANGLPAPCRNLWNFTTVKAMLENPTYCGDLVWNRRTEAKFYRLRNGRAEERRRQPSEAKVVKTPKQDWLVIPDAVPAIVPRNDWEKAQVMVSKRRQARGGAGHRNRRWLLTGVLVCGDCGHKFWGDPRHKGHVQGRAEVITNYYSCAGRRSYGSTICQMPSTLRAEQLEAWVLGKLQELILADEDALNMAVERFVELAVRHNPGATEAERIAREIKEVNELVTALTMNIDPLNLPLLNERLTRLRFRKESLEREHRAVCQSSRRQDAEELRRWAHSQLAGLQAAMAGARNDRTRDVIGTYVDRITVWPSQKRGEMRLNSAAAPLWKQNDRPEGRSRVNKIGATRFELATSWTQSPTGKDRCHATSYDSMSYPRPHSQRNLLNVAEHSRKSVVKV